MQMTRSSSNEELILNFLRYGADEEYASRANALSFAKSVLCSYALPIAKFWRPKEIGGATLFVLERDGLSQTTSAHISRVRTTAARLHVNALPVPDLDMTYNDAHQYALDKLSTIAARWEKSHSNLLGAVAGSGAARYPGAALVVSHAHDRHYGGPSSWVMIILRQRCPSSGIGRKNATTCRRCSTTSLGRTWRP